MGVTHGLVAPDGTVRFDRETVEDYWDFVAARERSYDREHSYAERQRALHLSRIEDRGVAMLGEKIDLLGDALRYPEGQYPDRTFPTDEETPAFERRDLTLLLDCYAEAKREYERRDDSGRSQDWQFDVRWFALVEYALITEHGIVKM